MDRVIHRRHCRCNHRECSGTFFRHYDGYEEQDGCNGRDCCRLDIASRDVRRARTRPCFAVYARTDAACLHGTRIGGNDYRDASCH